MTRHSRAALTLVTILGLAACGENAATRATPERLAALLEDGIDADRAARADDRLASILARDNATGALAGPYGGQEDGTDASLGPLLVAALERNTTIGAAAQDINRADAARLNAIFGYLPQLSFDATYSQINQRVIESDNAVFQEGEADYPVLDYRVLLTQPLVDLGRLFGIRVADNARSLAEVNYIASVRDVSFEVVDAYLVALQSGRQAAFLRQRQALLSRQAATRATLEEIGLGDLTAEASVRGEAASLAAREAAELASAGRGHRAPERADRPDRHRGRRSHLPGRGARGGAAHPGRRGCRDGSWQQRRHRGCRAARGGRRTGAAAGACRRLRAGGQRLRHVGVSGSRSKPVRRRVR